MESSHVDERFNKRYKVLQLMGCGCYSKVFKVQDLQILPNPIKALKIIQTKNRNIDVSTQVDRLKKLNCIFVVQYYDYFVEIDHSLGLVFEFLNSGNLAIMIKNCRESGRNGLDDVIILKWTLDLLEGLDFLHTTIGVVHLDIKPTNIFICDKQETVKIGDFKAVRDYESLLEIVKIEHEASYVSPEIVRVDQKCLFDFKTDIWSLGCVLYEMITLKRAFQAENLYFMLKNICDGKVLINEHVDAYYVEILKKCFKVEAIHRLSAKELIKYIRSTRKTIENLLHDRRNLIAKGERQSKSFADVCLSLGDEYIRMDDKQNALECYLESLKLRTSLSNNKCNFDLALCMRKVAFAYQNLHNFQKALEYYEPSLNMYKLLHTSNHHVDLAVCLTNMGVVNQNLGLYDTALRFHTQAYETYVNVYHDHHPDVAISLNHLGSVHQQLGHLSQAVEYFTRSKDMYMSIYPMDNVSTAVVLNNLASAYHELDDAQSLTFYSQALDMYERLIAKDERTNIDHLAKIHNGIASFHQKTGNNQIALEHYHKSLKIYRERNNYPETGGCLYNMGFVYAKMSNHGESLNVWRESLSIYRKLYPEKSHRSTAACLNSVGSALMHTGEYQKALDCYREAFEMSRQLYVPNHVLIAACLNNIGSAYNRLNDYRNAFEHFDKSLNIYRIVYPSTDNLDFAACLYNVATAQMNLDQSADALNHYKEAIEMYARLGDKLNQARSLNGAGFACQSQALWSEALEYYEQSVQLYSIVHENIDHVDIAVCWNNIGMVHANTSNFNDSLLFHNNSLKMLQRLRMENTVQYGLVEYNLGFVDVKLYNYINALNNFTRSRQVLMSIYNGSDHTHIAMCVANIGLVLLNLGKCKEALTNFEESLTMYKRLNRVADIAMLLDYKGQVHDMMGNLNEAIKNYEESLKTYSSDDQLNVLLVLNNLSSAHRRRNSNQNDQTSALEYKNRLESKIQTLLGSEPHPLKIVWLNNVAMAYENDGNFDEAFELYNQCLDMARRAYADNHVSTAVLLNNIGSVHRQKGNFPNALDFFNQALNEYKKHPPPHVHPTMATILNNIGSIFEILGDLSNALYSYEQSGMMRLQLGINQADMAASLMQIASVHIKLGHFSEARSKYEQSLKILDNLPNRNSNPQRAMCLNNMGLACQLLGRYDESLKLYQKSLEIYQQLVGSDDRNRATVVNNLATAHHNLGETVKAKNYYEQFMEIYKSLPQNEQSLEDVTLLQSAGLACGYLGQLNESLNYCGRSMSVCGRLLDCVTSTEGVRSILNSLVIGSTISDVRLSSQSLQVYAAYPNHYCKAAAFNCLAFAHENLGDYQNAIGYYKKSLDMTSRAGGEGSLLNPQCVARILNSLACVHDSVSDWADSFRYCSESLRTANNTDGNSANRAVSFNNMGSVYENLGDYNLALDCYNQALEIYKTLYGGRNHPSTAVVLNNVGHALINLNRDQEAINCFQQSIDMNKRLNCVDDAVILNNIAAAYFNLNDLDNALEYFNQSLDKFEKVHKEDHPFKARIWTNKGLVYEKKVNYHESLKCYEKARQNYEKQMVGLDNPMIVSILDRIGNVHQLLNDFNNARNIYQQSLDMKKHLLEAYTRSMPSILNNMDFARSTNDHFTHQLNFVSQLCETLRQTSRGNHPSVAISLARLAYMYQRLNEQLTALDFYRQSFDMYENVNHISIGCNQLEFARALRNAASLYAELRQYSNAIDFYKRSLDVYRALNDQPSVAELLSSIACAYTNGESYTEALDFYQQSLDVYQSISDSEPSIAEIFTRMGDIYRIREEVDDMLKSYVKALEIYEKLHVHEHAEKAKAMRNVAFAYEKSLDFDQALTYYLKSYAEYVKLGPAHSSDEAIVAYEIGSIYRDKKDYSKALEFFTKSCDKCQKADVYKNLGFVYFKLGSLNEALDSYMRGLEMYQELDDDHKKDIAFVMNGIGRTHQRLKNYSEALNYYLLLETHPGLDAPADQAKLLKNIGAVYELMDEYQSAVDYYLKSHDITVKNGHSVELASILNLIACVSVKNDDLKNALKFFRKSKKEYETLGPIEGNASVAFILNRMGDVYEKLDDKKNALDHWENSLVIFKLLATTHYREVISVLNKIARLNETDNLHRALAYLKQSLQYYEDFTDENQTAQERADLLEKIADLFKKIGQYENAAMFYSQSLKIYRQLAHGTPVTEANILNSLGFVYNILGDQKSALEAYSKSSEIFIKLNRKLDNS